MGMRKESILAKVEGDLNELVASYLLQHSDIEYRKAALEALVKIPSMYLANIIGFEKAAVSLEGLAKDLRIHQAQEEKKEVSSEH